MVNVNTPFNQLPVVVSIDGSEVIALDQGGTTKQATLDQAISGAIQTNFPAAIEYVADGVSTALTAGVLGYLEIPFNCDVTFIDVLAGNVGNAQVDIWACSYDDFDAGVTHPVVGDSILSGSYPTIVAGTKARVSYGNDPSIAANTILAFVLLSTSGILRLTISISVQRDLT